MFVYAWLCGMRSFLRFKSGSPRRERTTRGELSRKTVKTMGDHRAKKHRIGTVVRLKATGRHGEDQVDPDKGLTCTHPDAIRRRRETTARELTQVTNMTRVNTLADYKAALKAADRCDKEVVVQFKTATCQSCLRVEYPLEVVARSRPETGFILVDLGEGKWEMAQLCEELGFSSVPYFVSYVGTEIRESGSWDSIGMLAENHSPQDMRRCSVAKNRGLTRDRVESSTQTVGDKYTKGKQNTLSGLDILKQAKTIY